LPTCAPVANRRKRRGLATRAQDDILPHKRDSMIACDRIARDEKLDCLR
jgi:hypothetical protein